MLEAAELAKAVWAFVRRHWMSVSFALVAAAAYLQLATARIENHRLADQLTAAKADASAAHLQLDTLATASSAREAAAKAQARAAQVVARQYQAQAAKITATQLPAGVDHCAAASSLITQTLTDEALR